MDFKAVVRTPLIGYRLFTFVVGAAVGILSRLRLTLFSCLCREGG